VLFTLSTKLPQVESKTRYSLRSGWYFLLIFAAMSSNRVLPIYSIESLLASERGPRDFEFFRFEYFAQDIEHLRSPHRHHFYSFILVSAGSGSHAIDFKEYGLQKGRLFLIAPGQVHAWTELKGVKGFVVLFNNNFIALSKGRKVMSAWPLFRLNQPPVFDLTGNEFDNWLEEMLFMEKEYLLSDGYTRDSLFYSLGYLLVRASRLSAKDLAKVDNARDLLSAFQELIEKNFASLKMPKDYATRLNITPNYLNALCKKKSGKSAGELIRQRILLEAKRLLAHTDLTVAEIAYKLKFEDNSYFGRFFRKYARTSPANFRKAQQG